MENRSTVWPEWTIEEELGSGSFGHVYKIRRDDYDMESYAALKVIRIPREQKEIEELAESGMDHEDIRSYFREMVRSLAAEIKLMEEMKSAANVVSIEDYVIREREDGIGWCIYIRMELLESISEYRARIGGLTLTEVLQLGIDMCSALESCQKAGITHRDIKPDNVFRSKYGDFKLGDFGIARQIQTMTLLMHSHKGTTTYMAPEVIRREDYDSTVDLYALGIMLYRFMNHNRLPYLPQFPAQIRPDDMVMATERRLAGEPMPLPDQADGELATYIMKACAYWPEDRYQSPSELRRDLEKYLFRLREWMETHGKQDMNVAYDPENLKRTYGEDHTGMDNEATATVVGLPDFQGTDLGRTLVLDPEPETQWEEETDWEFGSIWKLGNAEVTLDEVEVPEEADEQTETSEPESKERTFVRRSKRAAHEKPQDSWLARKWKPLLAVILVLAVICGGMVYAFTQFTKVPGVERKALKEAKQLLTEAGLNYDVEKEYSDEVAKGSVISQSPGSTAIKKRGTVIHLIVSRGSNRVTVPDVVGLSEGEAIAKLKESDLAVKVTEVDNPLKHSGVTGQSVGAGERVIRETEVEITVNTSTLRDNLSKWLGGGN